MYWHWYFVIFYLEIDIEEDVVVLHKLLYNIFYLLEINFSYKLFWKVRKLKLVFQSECMATHYSLKSWFQWEMSQHTFSLEQKLDGIVNIYLTSLLSNLWQFNTQFAAQPHRNLRQFQNCKSGVGISVRLLRALACRKIQEKIDYSITPCTYFIRYCSHFFNHSQNM